MEQSGPAERMAAISALYQADRSDEATKQTLNAAIVGIALTYAGISLALVSQASPPNDPDPWVIALLPAPLWIVAVFLGLFAAAQARRGYSAVLLEQRLFEIARLSVMERAAIGLTGVRQILDWRHGPLTVKLSLLLAFGGEVLVVLGYTIFMLVRAYNHRPLLAELILPSLFYLGAFTMLATTWVVNTRRYPSNA